MSKSVLAALKATREATAANNDSPPLKSEVRVIAAVAAPASAAPVAVAGQPPRQDHASEKDRGVLAAAAPPSKITNQAPRVAPTVLPPLTIKAWILDNIQGQNS